MDSPVSILDHFLDITIMGDACCSIIPLVHCLYDCLILLEQLIVK